MPKTMADGCGAMPSITSSSGVAACTPLARWSWWLSWSGRIDAVGSATPFWKMPMSASPRWMRSPALFFSPDVTESSATIVATPMAMPMAVSAVRAGRRNRLEPITASTAGRD